MKKSSESWNQKRREFLADCAKIGAVIGAVAAFPALLNAVDSSNSKSANHSTDSAQSKGDSSADSTTSQGDSRTILLYYSRTLNTHILASYAQSVAGVALWRAQTAQPYPQDYRATVALASEQRKSAFLPPLRTKPDISAFESVIIAAPLWGMDICAPMKSLLSSLDLRGKRLFLIVTNAGYGLGKSVQSVQKYAKMGDLAGILDYPFKNYEKIVPNLLTINQREIAQNRAFDMLDKDKIRAFLAKI